MPVMSDDHIPINWQSQESPYQVEFSPMNRLPLLLAFLLTACASNQVWHNPKKSQKQFFQDRAECTAMGAGSAGYGQWGLGARIAASRAREQITSDCMRARDWELVDKDKLTPGSKIGE